MQTAGGQGEKGFMQLFDKPSPSQTLASTTVATTTTTTTTTPTTITTAASPLRVPHSPVKFALASKIDPPFQYYITQQTKAGNVAGIRDGHSPEGTLLDEEAGDRYFYKYRDSKQSTEKNCTHSTMLKP
jgi:hypothetical protein